MNNGQKTFFKSDGKTKWWKLRKINEDEYGYTAVISLLSAVLLKGWLGGILLLIGVLFGIKWLMKRK